MNGRVFFLKNLIKLLTANPSWLDTDTIKNLHSANVPLLLFHKQETLPVIKLSEITTCFVNLNIPLELFSEKRMSNFAVIEDILLTKQEAVSQKNYLDYSGIPTIIKHLMNSLYLSHRYRQSFSLR